MKELIMNLKNVKAMAAAVLIVAFMLIAGRSDYEQEVLYSMPNGVWELMKEKMPEASEGEIVDEYQENKAYWHGQAGVE